MVAHDILIKKLEDAKSTWYILKDLNLDHDQDVIVNRIADFECF